MTFVVTESCIQCVYTDCVEVCPMACFKIGPNFMVIDPVTCIDCAMCVPECPVGAIYSEHDVPDAQRHFIAINAELAEQSSYVTHPRKTVPMPDHEDYKDQADKIKLLSLHKK